MHSRRRDILQCDIIALLSLLIGTPAILRFCTSYIYKGMDRTALAITEIAANAVDTIKQWKSLRCLTASEAAWRCIIHDMHFRTPAAERNTTPFTIEKRLPKRTLLPSLPNALSFFLFPTSSPWYHQLTILISYASHSTVMCIGRILPGDYSNYNPPLSPFTCARYLSSR